MKAANLVRSRVAATFLAATLLTVILGVGAAQGAAPIAPAQAPVQHRAAILVGVQKYRPDGYNPGADANVQMLRNLNTPCEDVEEVSKQLQLAGWKFDNSDAKAEIHTYCDADLSTVRADIEKRVADFDNPGDLLIIFFAGHGAEVGGRNYFFGPLAKLDMKVAVRRLQDYSKNLLFVGQALDLDNAVLLPAGLNYHGNMLVILGACRDDPVTYGAVANALHLSVGPPSYGVRPGGVKILYATTPGLTIADGTGLSNLARAFSAHIHRGVRVYKAIIDSAHDVITATARLNLENPVAVGDFNDIDLCFSGCSSAQTQSGSDENRSFRILNVSGVAQEPATPLSGLSSTNLIEGFRVRRTLPAGLSESTSTTVPIGVDIYWCESGGLSKHREEAEKLANDMAKFASDTHGLGGHIGTIRTKPLTDAENTRPSFRFARNAVRYRIDNNQAAAIAKVVDKFVSSASLQPLEGAGPDVVNIFLCAGGKNFPKSPRLFMQAAAPEQRGIATFISSQIERSNPDVWVADGVDIRPKVQEASPEHTVVKFFDTADKDLAFRIAKSLDSTLPSASKVVFAPPRGSDNSQLRGLVEIWLGRDLQPSQVRTVGGLTSGK